MAKVKKFRELDVTNFSKRHLAMLFHIIIDSRNITGWAEEIDDLDMFVDERGRIIVRGWATKRVWDNFRKTLIDIKDSTIIVNYEDWY